MSETDKFNEIWQPQLWNCFHLTTMDFSSTSHKEESPENKKPLQCYQMRFIAMQINKKTILCAIIYTFFYIVYPSIELYILQLIVLIISHA